MRVKQACKLAAAATMAVSAIVAAEVVASPLAEAQPAAFISGFSTVSTVASTVPGNGDVNPYGVAVIRHSQGRLVKGNILVSNFNNSANQQGTGTTIVSVSPHRAGHVFAQISATPRPASCPGGIGLTTALSILHGGWGVVGSLPPTKGDPAPSQARA